MDIFLESTAFIELWIKGGSKAAAVHNIVGSHNKLSSQFVRHEIRRGYLNNLILLHNKAVELGSIADCLNYAQKFTGYHPYTASSMIESIALFMKGFEQSNKAIPANKSGKLLVAWLRTRIRSFAEHTSSSELTFIDETRCFQKLASGCDPVYEKPMFIHGYHKCDSSYCEVLDFFKTNRSHVRDILDRIDVASADTETKNRVRILKEIIRVPGKLISGSDCRKCGDALIALESPQSAVLVTSNKKHYEPICSVLGKQAQYF